MSFRFHILYFMILLQYYHLPPSPPISFFFLSPPSLFPIYLITEPPSPHSGEVINAPVESNFFRCHGISIIIVSLSYSLPWCRLQIWWNLQCRILISVSLQFRILISISLPVVASRSCLVGSPCLAQISCLSRSSEAVTSRNRNMWTYILFTSEVGSPAGCETF